MNIFGLYITKASVREKELQTYEELQKDLEDMRWFTSDFIPGIEELFFALQQAKVGAASRGRRMNRRRLFRIWNKVKTRMAAA